MRAARHMFNLFEHACVQERMEYGQSAEIGDMNNYEQYNDKVITIIII